MKELYVSDAKHQSEIIVMIRALDSFDMKQKRVLMRVDFNVPIENDRVVDSFRIQSAIPSIKECLESGSSIVLISHLGRPNGNVDEKLSLVPVGEALADILEIPIKELFDPNCIREEIRWIDFIPQKRYSYGVGQYLIHGATANMIRQLQEIYIQSDLEIKL